MISPSEFRGGLRARRIADGAGLPCGLVLVEGVGIDDIVVNVYVSPGLDGEAKDASVSGGEGGVENVTFIPLNCLISMFLTDVLVDWLVLYYCWKYLKMRLLEATRRMIQAEEICSLNGDRLAQA